MLVRYTRFFNKAFFMFRTKKNSAKAKSVKWLRFLREELGLSKYAMARKIGVTPQSYQYLEARAKGCQIKTLVDAKRGTGKSWEEIGRLFEKDIDVK